MYKLWTLLWVARWMETGGEKPWEAKPIQMSIKARGFTAMRWFPVMCNAAPVHISPDLMLVNPHLSFIRSELWVQTWGWRWDMAGGLPLWEEHPVCQSMSTQVEVGTLQFPLPDGQAERLSRWLEPSRNLKIPPPCIHKKKYKQPGIKKYNNYEMTVNIKCLQQK